jgi:SsrA-binding protein
MVSEKTRGEKRLVCRNKRARFNYKINDVFEAGMVLMGSEVKSLRMGQANLSDGYARIIDGEVWLINAHISPYKYAYHANHEPGRRRKLLLHKQEIRKLYGKTQEKGMSLIPLSIYFKGGKAKVELGLAVGKQLHDKRQTIKQRMADREMSRAIRRGMSGRGR